MPEFSPQELAGWSGGVWTRSPEEDITSVCHDTRELTRGGLYVAIRGERVDGHDFSEAARKAGAAAMLCEKGRTTASLPCLEVADTGKALEDLARGYRQTLNPRRMIGITGSAGKTTVKDFLAAMLSEAGKTRSTRGNWNNFIGLPLSLLAMEPEDRFGVFELGMNRAGEIAALAEILKPDAALITSIGEAHLEQLGSVEAIAEEKTSLLVGLSAEDVSVLDADSPWFAYIQERCNSGAVRVSLEGDADYRGQVMVGGLKISERKSGESYELQQPLPGEHMAGNLLQAVAMARECGLRVDQIQRGLETYIPAPMRWQKMNLESYAVINDAYNANPLSMRKSIRTFAEEPAEGEKWLVLGGMGELGEAEKELHGVVGKELDGYGFDGVILVGEKGGWIQQGIAETNVITAETHAQAAATIRERVPRGSALLFKASRSEHLETIIKKMTEMEGTPI